MICVGAAFWYNRFTPDGVEKHHFFSWQTYTWDDADYYTLKANRDGVLKFELVMEDGEAFFLLIIMWNTSVMDFMKSFLIVFMITVYGWLRH